VFLVKFPVIVVVYVATSLVNTDEYTIYYAYDSVYKVPFNYGRCFPFVYIYACTAVFLCCCREYRFIYANRPNPLNMVKKVQFSHTRYRASGPELIPVEPTGDVKRITP